MTLIFCLNRCSERGGQRALPSAPWVCCWACWREWTANGGHGRYDPYWQDRFQRAYAWSMQQLAQSYVWPVVIYPGVG